MIVPLILLSSLRVGVGTDFYSYQYVFQVAVQNFQNGNFSVAFSGTEPLYVALEFLSYLLKGANFNFFLLITSIFTLVPVISLIMSIVPRKLMAVSLFLYLFIFYLTSFNIIRQMIAVSFVIYSFRYIIEKKQKRFIFWIICATLFHNSAIVALLFYYLNMEFSLYKKMPIKQLVNVVLILLIPLILFVLIRYGQYLPLIGSYFRNYSNVQNISNNYFIILTLLPIIPAVLYKNSIVINDSGNQLFNIMLMTLLFAILGVTNEWAFRLMYYSSSVVILVYPMILSRMKKINYYLSFGFFIIFIWVVFFLTFVVFGFNDVLPYENIPMDTLFLEY